MGDEDAVLAYPARILAGRPERRIRKAGVVRAKVAGTGIVAARE